VLKKKCIVKFIPRQNYLVGKGLEFTQLEIQASVHDCPCDHLINHRTGKIQIEKYIIKN
jgi:hypothetical protein